MLCELSLKHGQNFSTMAAEWNDRCLVHWSEVLQPGAEPLDEPMMRLKTAKLLRDAARQYNSLLQERLSTQLARAAQVAEERASTQAGRSSSSGGGKRFCRYCANHGVETRMSARDHRPEDCEWQSQEHLDACRYGSSKRSQGCRLANADKNCWELRVQSDQ